MMDIHKKQRIKLHIRAKQNKTANKKEKTFEQSECKGSKKEKKESAKKDGALKQGIYLAEIYASEKVAEQLEGGEEFRDASLLYSQAVRPVNAVTKKIGNYIKEKKQERKKEKIKVKSSGSAVKKKERFVTAKEQKKPHETRRARAEYVRESKSIFFQKSKILKKVGLKEKHIAVKKVATTVGGIMAGFFSTILLCTVPIICVVMILYNSPFALFLPPLQEGETVQSVTDSYMEQFIEEVEMLADEHEGYDAGELVYVDYEGTEQQPTNYYDIMCIYMVRHGIGDTAIIINEKSEDWLSDVFLDMCSYTTEITYETVENEDGTTSTKSTLRVNVFLKNYRDMIERYHFNDDQIEILEKMMNPEYRAILGEFNATGGGNTQSSILPEDRDEILSGVSEADQNTVVSFVLDKVGYPYSQEYRDSGEYFDCSSLAYYAWRAAGKNISYNGATSAAAIAEGLDVSGRTVSYSEIQPGDLIFYSYCNNGRYMNISHVAIYVGNGKVVEAKSEQYGVVFGNVPNRGSIVLIGRP